MHITFLLPGRGGGGGAHSVVQEAGGLKRLGLDVAIATTKNTFAAFSANYPDLAHRSIGTMLYGTPEELGAALKKTDIVIATTYESAHELSRAKEAAGSNVKTAYYVQDYEPLFRAPGTEDWQRAYDSYALDPERLMFAKTDWICGMVEKNHGRPVQRVLASIDHETYFPARFDAGKPFVVSTMMRPKTPRRAPYRTARILERLAAELPGEAQIVSFGSDRDELAAAGIRFSDRITVRGHLSRKEVAAVLRVSDLFLDLSDYQAFGRTGLEAMACGAIALLPVFGGTGEYARHWENAILADTRDEDAVFRAIMEFSGMSQKARAGLRAKAIETALSYSIERAAFSELQLFEKLHAA